MKYIALLILPILLAACNQNDRNKKADTPVSNDSLPGKKDSLPGNTTPDSNLLMQTSVEVLKAIKERDYTALGKFIHPASGIRFSPYGFIDSSIHRLFTTAKFLKAAKSQQRLFWGIQDGSGDSIKMTMNQYFGKFVYDVDFLNAEEKSVNRFLKSGNSLNNLQEIYPGAIFTEFYFSGFDAKYAGMDSD